MPTRTRISLLPATLLVTWVIVSIWVLRVPAAAQRKYEVFAATRSIAGYLAANEVRKLQIGAGTNNLPGWLNTDIEPGEDQVFLDASKPFPIPDRSLDYVYAEQVIEHLPLDGGMVMLRESYRTLAPGGRLRIATPDLQRLVALFDADATPAERRFMDAQLSMARVTVKESERPLFVMNMYFHAWGHRFLYDQRTLQSALESAGFHDVRFVRHGESDDLSLQNIERHVEVIGRDIDEYVTMIVEARKAVATETTLK